MAEKVTAFKDANGNLHETEEAADGANAGFRAVDWADWVVREHGYWGDEGWQVLKSLYKADPYLCDAIREKREAIDG